MSAGETVTVRPGTTLDSKRDPVPASGTTFDIEGCVIEPLGSEEVGEVGRRIKVTRIRIFSPGPISRPITATDVVEARGVQWAIDGHADDWVDEDPELAGPVITASRGEG